MGCRIQGKDHALKHVKLSLWQFKGCTEIPVVGSNASICCLEAVGVTRRKRVEGKEARTGRSKQTHDDNLVGCCCRLGN